MCSTNPNTSDGGIGGYPGGLAPTDSRKAPSKTFAIL